MKRIVGIILLLLLVTGCTNKINIKDYDNILDTFLSKKSELVNNYAKGYKYYLPIGVRVLESKDFNDKLSCSGYDYYLYVDIVSYYYKTSIDYNIDKSSFYSKIFNYNGIDGYIEIKEFNDLYKIVMYYNYAKIEGYASKENLSNAIINMCYILNSIKVNDSVVELMIGNEEFNSTEEVFDFYKPRKEGNFINYINQFDEYKEDVENENNIGNEGN